jgi:hypothetical protein
VDWDASLAHQDCRALLTADNVSDPKVREWVEALLGDAGRPRDDAAANLLASAASFSDGFASGVQQCLVRLFGSRAVGATAMTVFYLLGDAAAANWSAAGRAAADLLGNAYGAQAEEAVRVVATAVVRGDLVPTPDVATSLICSLRDVSLRAWEHSAGGQRSRESFEQFISAAPAVAHDAIIDALGSPEEWLLQKGATGVSVWLRHHPSNVPMAPVLRLVLDAVLAVSPVRQGTDELLDALNKALIDLLDAAPRDTAAELLRQIALGPAFATERLSRPFRSASLALDLQASWLAVVMDAIRDPALDLAARCELAREVEAAASQQRETLGPALNLLLDVVATLSAELGELAAGSFVDRDFAITMVSAAEKDVQTIAGWAAIEVGPRAFDEIEARIASATDTPLFQSGLVAVASVASLADRALFGRLLPIVAPMLLPTAPPVAMWGALEGLAGLARKRRDLLPDDLLRALSELLELKLPNTLHYFVLQVFDEAEVVEFETAKVTFERLVSLVADWLTGASPVGYLRDALDAARNLARQHPSLRDGLVKLGVQCAAAREASSARDGLRCLAIAASWYGGSYQGRFVEAWLAAARRHGFAVSISRVYPHYEDSLGWLFGFGGSAVRAVAPDLLALALEREDPAEFRCAAGILVSFGDYLRAAEALDALALQLLAHDQYGAHKPEACEANAFASALQAEVEFGNSAVVEAEAKLEAAATWLRRADAARADLEALDTSAMEPGTRGAVTHARRRVAWPWLPRWVAFREHWLKALQDEQLSESKVQSLRSDLQAIGPFGPDRHDDSARRIVEGLVSSAANAASWYDAVRGARGEASAERDAAVAGFGAVQREQDRLGAHRTPSAFTLAYNELVALAEALLPAHGPDRLFQRLVSIPMPVPRSGLPVRGRGGRAIARAGRLHRRRAPSLRHDSWVVRVTALIDGERLEHGAFLSANVTYSMSLTIRLADRIRPCMLRIEPASTLPRSLFVWSLDDVEITKGVETVEVTGILCFVRAQSPSSPPHELKFLITAVLADGADKEVAVLGDHAIVCHVGATQNSPMARPSSLPTAPTVVALPALQPPVLTADEEREFARAGMLSKTPIHLSGIKLNRGYVIQVGSEESEIGTVPLKRLLLLVAGLYSAFDGWVVAGTRYGGGGLTNDPLFASGDGFDMGNAISRIRPAFRGKVRHHLTGEVLKGEDFIRYHEHRVRLATHRRYVTWDETQLRQSGSQELRAALEALLTAEATWSAKASEQSASSARE